VDYYLHMLKDANPSWEMFKEVLSLDLLLHAFAYRKSQSFVVNSYY
jgi:hypothetical protein